MLSSFSAYRQAANLAVRAQQLDGEIRFLDEVLTMSARLGAVSGDAQWQARYDAHVEKLDGAIKAMASLGKNNRFAPMLAQTDAANQALILLETRAFALAQKGERKQAYELLLSADYAGQKSIYAMGLEQASGAVRADFAKDATGHWRLLVAAALAAMIGAVVCFAGWFALVARVLSRQDGLHRLVREERDTARLANRAKSQFLANMSHELRTPLNAIIGYSELMLETAIEDHRNSEIADLNNVLGASRHLLALINDLLDFSRAEAGKIELHSQRVDIKALLENTCTTIAPAAAKRANTVCTEFAEPLGTAHTDGLRLSQCVLNLLSNAAKFTQAGTITLRARRFDQDGCDWLELIVSDTGCGMAPEHLARIFEPFTQADSEATRAYQGAGLGLSITRQLARLLGGDVNACSKPGVGSCFTLTLPCALATEKRDAAAPNEHRQAA